MYQSLHIFKKWRQVSGTVFCLFICLPAFITFAFAQTKEWIYIARSEEGRFYVKRKIDQLSYGNRAIWMKVVSDKGLERINYTEWNCKDRRFHILHTSLYTADGRAIEHLKNLDWAFVTPETVSENLFEEACGTQREVKYAVITSKKINLRREPNINGEISRIVKHDEKFILTPFDPINNWYQIYDPETLVEYWVHKKGIKIFSIKSDGK